ncbi:MAG: phosphomannomutase/phosphoglucomutase [Gammaproteobacteria bacterium]|nr:phosphomannomutase/phosphoglucomutase [Gammaproteobacteria bacterium]MBU1654073.1 phosphomannomutase/phosphoglucomutase [Gammaproteobacteria bacterium]MBU1962314.1 phosphomannomutase/phosphoglucomutase [Gammaproteobacteria bacterium]
MEMETNIPSAIFRAYDIRGVVGKTLTEEIVYDIGKAIGSEAYEAGQQTVIVARDGRTSGEALLNALVRGLTSTGRDVVDIGMAPTPLLYFATHFLGSNTGVMVTGSHNPPEYNGLKVVINGHGLHGQGIKAIYDRAVEGRFLIGNGTRMEQSLIPDYIQRVCNNLTLQGTLRVVVDCGNGVAGRVAPDLLRALGCEVKELFTKVDGTFPNHHPDPSRPENLKDLIEAVLADGADLGIAYDGDGDRIGVIDSNGKIIWPDRLLMLLADDILARNPGADVIYDIKSTRHIAPRVLSMGGRPVLWKTGHSLIKAKMRETGALLAGEMSGHIFIKERWYGFDDALYASARLLEILAIDSRSSALVFADLPEDVSTPEIHLEITDGSQQATMNKIIDAAAFDDANLITLDGLRAEFPEGWGLVRASNTTPALVFRFEARDAASLEKIQGRFRDLLKRAVPGLEPPF